MIDMVNFSYFVVRGGGDIFEFLRSTIVLVDQDLLGSSVQSCLVENVGI